MSFLSLSLSIEAVLIDLDRAVGTGTGVSDLRYDKGVMYTAPASWTAEMLDWRQFGYLLAYYHQDNVQGYHDMQLDADVQADPFISKLISEG